MSKETWTGLAAMLAAAMLAAVMLAAALAVAVVVTSITTLLSHTPWWSPLLAVIFMVAVIWWGIWAVGRLEARR